MNVLRKLTGQSCRIRSGSIIGVLLAFGAVALPLSGQRRNAITDCTAIVTTGDAARCIGSAHSSAFVPSIDSRHIYTLPELIDIAETASREGRIAWPAAKVPLERAGIDRASYLPILTCWTRSQL